MSLPGWSLVPVLGVDMSPLHATGVVGQKLLFVYTFMFWTSVVVAAGVAGTILFAAIRFRARGDKAEPRQVVGNARLELAWTLLPFLIVASLFALTAVNMPSVVNPPPHSMQISVRGIQYVWDFSYPGYTNRSGQTIHTAEELVLPANTPVELNVTSGDVDHSFYVPTLGGQINAIPGQMNHMWVEAKPGTYYGQCTELCGIGHAFMVIQVDMLAPAQWQAWLAKEQSATSTTAG